MADLNRVILQQLDRLAADVHYIRERQEATSVEVASMCASYAGEDVKNRLETMRVEMATKDKEADAKLSKLCDAFNNLKTDMAVVQAKAGGIMGLLGGGLATGILEALRWFLERAS